MSLGARATKGGAGGAGGAKSKDKHAQDKPKADKPPAKEKVKPQATTEQLRMAHMIDRKSEDASDVRRMVLELMEMTCRTEEEVCSALHDSDNDMVAACNLLLEDTQRIQGEWQTSEKKKKKPPAAPGNGNGNGEPEPPRERDAREPRERSGPPRPRRSELEGGRGGRGGAGRGRGAMRGRGRGARRPPAPRAPRNDPLDLHRDGNNMADSFPNAEDWDNEEWSGSLSDTKVLVFTPSTSGQMPGEEPPATNATEDWESPTAVSTANGPTEHIPSYTYHARMPEPPRAPDQIGSTHHAAAEPAPAPEPPAPAAHPAHPAHPAPRHQPMGMSGSLSAAQSQYLSQLTQQSQRHDNSVYSSNYGVYGATDISSQRKPPRARVPPPSKIPSSAVEMPGGEGGAMFLDVQFGALEPDALQDSPAPASAPAPAPAPALSAPKPLPPQVAAPAEPQPVSSAHDTPTETPSNSYQATNSMQQMAESLSAEAAAPPPAEPAAPPANSLEKQLTAAMKQLAVSAGDAPAPAPQHHRHKTVGQQSVYAPHHAVSHHPPVYGANVYAPQQVNSTNASLTGASAMNAAAAYASNATLTQYQPMINSYQQTSSSAGVYAGSALYTYQPSPQTKLPAKDTPQYDNSIASSNSLTSTSTTQTSTAKVATTTVSGATAGSAAGVGGVGGVGGAGYGGALYGGVAGAPTGYAHYDEAQLITRTLPHPMTGYYEVGYGVGGAREGTFGLGPTERFTRTDAASPQQVSQVPAALPPGYAYFYQPPPTTYQYGVYPTYGGGSNVAGGVGGVGSVSGGVSGAGKVSSYSQQQPQYEQDSYKQGGGYNASANKAASGAPPELASAMYAKTHVALNKVNSYDKATFHSGTPPPFGAGSHLYIPAPHSQHHHPHHAHQPHQESGAARAAAKPAPSKPSYSQSYWAPN